MVRQSSVGTSLPKPQRLLRRQGNPRATLSGCASSAALMGLPNQGIDYYLITCLPFKNLDPERTFFCHWSVYRPAKHISCCRKCKIAGLTALPNSTHPAQNVAGKPQIAHDFETTEMIETRLPTFDKLFGHQIAAVFRYSPFDQGRKCSTAIP